MALTKITTGLIAANTLATANIADNSVDATKIAANSILTRHIDDDQVTGDQLADNITIAGNLVVSGNLTTNGSSVTNSSSNTTIEDNIIELGTGTSGSPSSDSGIVIERGSSNNAFMGWDESADKFILGTGTFTGASSGNLTITAAPLVTGALTASGLSFPTSDGTSGQVLRTDGSGALSFADNTTKVDNYTATGNGSTTAFDTGTNPGNEVNTWIFVDGVYQQKSQYSYSGSTVTFSTAPENGALIDVITGTSSNITASDTVLGVYEATTTNTDAYSTGISAANENNTWVFVGGVYQPKDSYTFSSGTLTFDANTPTGQKLSVVATKTLTAGTVDTASLAANAISSAKIASNAILSRHIVNNSIVGADISATTQITANTFTGALTGNVTGNVAGNLTGTILTAAQTNITSVGTLSAATVSGQLTAGGLAYPTSDGSNEQVLKTDGSGTISFGTVSGTTINNNTNNYVMTGTGSANTLNGESSLTYDGSTLAVEVSNNVFAGAFKQTNTSNGDGVHIRLGSAAAADYALRVDSDAGNTAGFVVKADGNVGIGTFTPSHPLTIQSSHQLTDVTGMSGNTTLLIGNTGTGNGVYNALQFSGNQQSMYIASINHGTEASRRLGFFLGSAGGDAVADERLSILGNGDVTLGANVQGAALIKGVSGNQTNRNAGGYPQYSFVGNEGTGMRRVSSNILALDAGGAEVMRLASGNVGIGTASAASKLHLESGNAHNKLSITSTASGGTGYDAVIDLLGSASNSECAINMGINGDADRESIKTYQSAMTFRTNNVDRLSIASNGGFTAKKGMIVTEAFAEVSNVGFNMYNDGAWVNGKNGYYSYLATNGGGVLRWTNSAVHILGTLSKSSGSFRIPHPVPSKTATHDLVHSFVEAPQADNIYRGVIDLVDGTASINIDTVSGMTEGTYVLLNTNTSCFTSNETDWDAVKGSVTGNILTISCQNSSSTATVSWLVIGERHDQHMYDTDWTDENGKVIVEPLKTEEMPQVNSGE